MTFNNLRWAPPEVQKVFQLLSKLCIFAIQRVIGRGAFYSYFRMGLRLDSQFPMFTSI
uniref:Bis5'-adenosyl-triphosphatase-like n=1 Tax=Rhizophora mucronata TaxID=61149 RepID=A0A2P2K456_RHIMU